MTSTYLSSAFVERRMTTIPALAVLDSWGVDRSGHYLQLDLKMCQLSALHFDFQWEEERTLASRLASARILRIDVSLNNLHFLHGDWLMPFKNLRALNASLNQIKHFQGLEFLQHLRSLNLSHNALRSTDGLLTSSTLEELRLAVNDIESISAMPSLLNLKILDISNNKLHSLDGLSSLPRLEELYAHRNELKDLLPLLSCGKLRVLNAANNRIDSLDTTLGVLSSLHHLQVVSLHSNPVEREPHYQGDILRTMTTIITLDNVVVKPLPKREEDHRRHANNLFTLKDAARQAFRDRMRVAKERLDDNVSFLQRRIAALQQEHQDFEVKLRTDLEACLRYLDTLEEEGLNCPDRSDIGAVLSRKLQHHWQEGPEKDKFRGLGASTDYSQVRETDELLRCAYNELVKGGANKDKV